MLRVQNMRMKIVNAHCEKMSLAVGVRRSTILMYIARYVDFKLIV